MSPGPVRKAGWVPTAALAVLAPLFGAGGGGLVVWQYPRFAPDVAPNSELERLRVDVAAIRIEAKNARDAASEAEHRIKTLEERVEEARAISLSCCTPKRNARR